MTAIFDYLLTIYDPRAPWKIQHNLADIVLLIFFARLAGAEYWEDIEDFGHVYESSLRKLLHLENGIPSHDTMQRVFATLDSQVLVEVTLMWSQLLQEAELSAKSFPTFAKRLLAIDGKTIRGNGSKAQTPLHIVTCYATDLGISYGQLATDDKSNEITAIPSLLDKVSIDNCLVTIDAMGTQKKIANKIIQKGGDYCLAVKENQKHLLEDIRPFFELELKPDLDWYETCEKAHGQIETRRYEVITDTAWLRQEHPSWGHIQAIGRAQLIIENQAPINRYFILSCGVSAKDFASYVRGHWQIESLHWQLDVVFREDANKTLHKKLAFNLNVMDKFCLAVLKQLNMGKKMSLRRKKYNLSIAFERYLDDLL